VNAQFLRDRLVTSFEDAGHQGSGGRVGWALAHDWMMPCPVALVVNTGFQNSAGWWEKENRQFVNACSGIDGNEEAWPVPDRRNEALPTGMLVPAGPPIAIRYEETG
jgi:hypothetical protein